MYAVETKHDTVLIENCLYGDVGAICCQWSIHHVVVVVGKLWTSPEILRENFPPPRGTQRGDVYSFSIISFEIMMRSEPYSFDHMTARGPYHMTARRPSTTWPLAVLVLRSHDRSRSLPHDRSRSFDHMTARGLLVTPLHVTRTVVLYVIPVLSWLVYTTVYHKKLWFSWPLCCRLLQCDQLITLDVESDYAKVEVGYMTSTQPDSVLRDRRQKYVIK